MISKVFDVDHDQANQHTKSSIEGSMENSILVANLNLPSNTEKKSHDREATRKSMPQITNMI